MGKATITDDEMRRLLIDQVVDFIGLTWRRKRFDRAGVLFWSEAYGFDIKLVDRGMRCLKQDG